MRREISIYETIEKNVANDLSKNISLHFAHLSETVMGIIVLYMRAYEVNGWKKLDYSHKMFL